MHLVWTVDQRTDGSPRCCANQRTGGGSNQQARGRRANYCRCAGYQQIIEAVLLAAEGPVATEAEPPPPALPDQAATPDARVAPQ